MHGFFQLLLSLFRFAPEAILYSPHISLFSAQCADSTPMVKKQAMFSLQAIVQHVMSHAELSREEDLVRSAFTEFCDGVLPLVLHQDPAIADDSINAVLETLLTPLAFV